MLIVIEGTDAAGKKTQSEILTEKLRLELPGKPVKLFSFPRYETELGEIILKHLKENAAPSRQDNINFQCLATADKIAASDEIKEILAKGGAVVADRWWQSGLVYGAADGLDVVWLRQMASGLPSPHLNLLLDVDPDVSLKRRPEARDRYEKDRDKQKAVRLGYRLLWSGMVKTSSWCWAIVDGHPSVDVVSENIMSLVRARKDV